ncbi:MAG: type IX secretion system membrane protein PorP/SprF [Prolixibacteraceae bacterium]|nr:type IX secretion system membrane protein PorP/SprF [Prolixibacteraceae bacterium]
MILQPIFRMNGEIIQAIRKTKLSVPFLILVGLGMLSFADLKAQDPQFSQFYSNPLYLNPAFAGTSSHPRIVSNYRNQWPSSGNTFVTYNVSYDKYLPGMKGAIGFQTLYDREVNGNINTVQSSFVYCYHVKVNDGFFFTSALQAGFILKQFNTKDLIFPGMINQENGSINGNYAIPVESGQKIFPDFTFGMVGQRRDYYFGFALSHLTNPNQSIIEGDRMGNLPMKFTLHAGAKTRDFVRALFSKGFSLSPNAIYQQQGVFKQLNLGMYMVITNSLTFGAWYRNNLSARPDAVIGMIGYSTPFFQLGYSFDYVLSELSTYSIGSHEISLIFYLERNLRKRPFYDTMRIPTL